MDNDVVSDADGHSMVDLAVGSSPPISPSASLLDVDPNDDNVEGSDTRSDTDEEHEHASLLHVRRSVVPRKDLHREIRARRDITTFASDGDSVVLHDLRVYDIAEIIDSLLDEMVTRGQLTDTQRGHAKEAALTPEFVPQLKSTMVGREFGQGIENAPQSFAVVMCDVPTLSHRVLALTTLHHDVNMGPFNRAARVVMLVLSPVKEKGTKKSFEVGRTFGTFFSDDELRFDIIDAQNEQEIRDVILRAVDKTAENPLEEEEEGGEDGIESVKDQLKWTRKFAGGLVKDIRRRLPYYLSDYKDGFIGRHTIPKTISTTVFLYFACLLPAIALGVLNEHNTGGIIDVQSMLVAQSFGGIVFALMGGQPLIILLSTAPLALYIKVIFSVSQSSGFDFLALYGWTGIWTAIFLIIFSVTDASALMRYSTRFTEEIFSLFILIAFSVDGIKPLVELFIDDYHSGDARDKAILALLLVLSTLWVGVKLFDFKKSVLMIPIIRNICSEYALPISVLINSAIGSGLFYAVELDRFNYESRPLLSISPLMNIEWWGIGMAAIFGGILSLLFFIDQNISAAMVNNPENKLKKGSAYHLDLLVVALITAVLSVFGLPWVHAAIPHSPLHVRALADVEDVFIDGTRYERVIRVRETRVTALVSHAMLGVSVLMLPIPLQLIPQAVLWGLFLYVAYTALDGNQFWERCKLIFTQQSQYPPNHYIRRVPQKYIHLFTLFQIACLVTLCIFGFFPIDFVQMTLPIWITLLIPANYFIAGKLFPAEYMKYLDSE
eukprot:TRINITY_DN16869_c0_g1_i1.p1 TRINITY_DN16869_c0_g1~~TRINITY_DN16869_c0_g1_i1.p1  ORF type:complete len:778 (+),score=185.50 TRINITY_DN16869_c0_g1_i1:219-2552(+)